MQNQRGTLFESIQKKSMKTFLLSPLLLLIALNALAQGNYTISGYVKDAASGETLIGTSVSVTGPSRAGTQANDYGFYSLSLPGGTYTVSVTSIGYTEYKKEVKLDKNLTLNIELRENNQTLDEVTISAEAPDHNVSDARMGVERLSMKEVNKLPVLFGERDVVKALTLLPGVKSGGEASSGFFVRGGAADQNLILLDEAIVYNPTHLLGFFSTFNSDAIKNVALYKGNMPAQFGGRLSSVMDVKMNEGNNKKFGVNGGIGLISSRLSVEGPIVKDKGSFLVSGRRTYADMFLKLSNDPEKNSNTLYFYDLNLKANYTLGEKDRLFLSGYFGKDKLGLKDLFGLDWGNSTGTLRWNHQFGPKVFSNTSLIYSDYTYNISINMNSLKGSIDSRIRDWNFKEEINWYLNARNEIRIGISSIHHTINPGTFSGTVTFDDQPTHYSWENAAYVNNSWKVSDKLNVDYGLRVSAFSVMGGEAPFYELDAEGQIIDTRYYSKGSIVTTYFRPEPRASASYRIGATSSLKAGYARNAQYLHLISNSNTGNPTDKWMATNNIVKPEGSDLFSIGYARNFVDNTYEMSIETYYKDMQHQIDYKDGANVMSIEPIEPQLLFGKGRAYGAEFLLRKNKGKLTGWIGYTLSRTEKQIDGINDNKWYAARQDRTHDLSIVAIYEANARWTLSGTFVYNTGNAVSFPSGKYRMDDQIIFLYTERNGYRMPAYHRLDLAATVKLGKLNKKRGSELAFGIYNAYGRENPFVITFEQNPDDPTRTRAISTALFRFVPSISYNFKF